MIVEKSCVYLKIGLQHQKEIAIQKGRCVDRDDLPKLSRLLGFGFAALARTSNHSELVVVVEKADHHVHRNRVGREVTRSNNAPAHRVDDARSGGTIAVVRVVRQDHGENFFQGFCWRSHREPSGFANDCFQPTRTDLNLRIPKKNIFPKITGRENWNTGHVLQEVLFIFLSSPRMEAIAQPKGLSGSGFALPSQLCDDPVEFRTPKRLCWNDRLDLLFERAVRLSCQPSPFWILKQMRELDPVACSNIQRSQIASRLQRWNKKLKPQLKESPQSTLRSLPVRAVADVAAANDFESNGSNCKNKIDPAQWVAPNPFWVLFFERQLKGSTAN